jgi:hypothetical protein
MAQTTDAVTTPAALPERLAPRADSLSASLPRLLHVTLYLAIVVVPCIRAVSYWYLLAQPGLNLLILFLAKLAPLAPLALGALTARAELKPRGAGIFYVLLLPLAAGSCLIGLLHQNSLFYVLADTVGLAFPALLFAVLLANAKRGVLRPSYLITLALHYGVAISVATIHNFLLFRSKTAWPLQFGVCLPLCLALLTDDSFARASGYAPRRGRLFVVFLVLLAGVFAALNRSTLGVLLVSVTAFGVRYLIGRRARSLARLGGYLALAAALVVVFFGPQRVGEELGRRYSATFESTAGYGLGDVSFAERWREADLILEQMAQARPGLINVFVGMGGGAVYVDETAGHLSGGLAEHHVHNSIIALYFRTGLLGASALVLAYAVAAGAGLRLRSPYVVYSWMYLLILLEALTFQVIYWNTWFPLISVLEEAHQARNRALHAATPSAAAAG